MIISMSRPWRHPDTGIYYYRARVPADLSAKLSGTHLTVEVATVLTRAKVRSIVKISLRTKDSMEARLRHASVQSQLELRWASARGRPNRLTTQEISGLAGVWYRNLVLTHQEDPGSVDGWEAFQDQLYDGLICFDESSDGSDRQPFDPDKGYRELGRCFDLGEFLTQRGLSIDEGTRQRLVQSIAWALINGCETLIRRAGGDYGPDQFMPRYPEAPKFRNRQGTKHSKSSSSSLPALFDGWAQESAPQQSTLDLWRGHLERFIEFLGHDDAEQVVRADVVRWKQHLIELGNSTATINGSKLAALKAIFRWGLENELVSINPAQGITVRRSKRAGESMRGFSAAEARAIIAAASVSVDAACKWVPQLCAQSGARVGEVCQLRAEDIQEEDGIWFMEFRSDAGSLKNRWSERRVPLHSELLASGFLQFVSARARGPLFYDPERRRSSAKKPQAKIVAKKVARWVHTLGLAVGKEERKAPNHAWRHLFRTLCRDSGVADSIASAILGHRPASVGEGYGETKLKTMSEAIERLPIDRLKG